MKEAMAEAESSVAAVSGAAESEMNDSEVVKVEGLTKRFGSFAAVDQVSFSVKRGEVFGFLGSNGSGKTTTVRMLCGILTPSAGTGNVLGFDLYRETENIRQAIGYMSQKFSLYQELTVSENLDFYAGTYSVSSKEASGRKRQLIEMVQLEGHEKQLAGTMSGGQKQRLALACSLLHRPSLVFLDEPTAGVDPLSRRNFWKILHQLAAQGVTVFVTTHYMDEADQCHRLGFMHRGRLIGLGSPAELKGSLGLDTMEEVFIAFAERGEEAVREP